MIVHQDQGRCTQFHRTFENFSRIWGDMVNRATCYNFVSKKAITRIEKKHAEILNNIARVRRR